MLAPLVYPVYVRLEALTITRDSGHRLFPQTRYWIGAIEVSARWRGAVFKVPPEAAARDLPCLVWLTDLELAEAMLHGVDTYVGALDLTDQTARNPLHVPKPRP